MVGFYDMHVYCVATFSTVLIVPTVIIIWLGLSGYFRNFLLWRIPTYYIIYRVNLFAFLSLHIPMLCNKYTEKFGDPTYSTYK